MAKEIIHNIQDLTDLSWDIIRNSSGTAGSFLKAHDDLGARILIRIIRQKEKKKNHYLNSV